MIVIVVGMHRSGTSAVAGILHLHGISMGSEKTFKPKPLPQNPMGFYENFGFRKLSDKILYKAGYKVKSFNSIIPQRISAERYSAKMERLIDQQESEQIHWGWKDPRVCLTLHCWLGLLENMELLHKTKIVFTYREADSVANSLKRRDGLRKKESIRLWCEYNRRALISINQNLVKTFYLSYEDLLNNPIDLCQKLFRFLEVDFKETVVNRFIDTNLNRSAIKDKSNDDLSVVAITESLNKLSAKSLR